MELPESGARIQADDIASHARDATAVQALRTSAGPAARYDRPVASDVVDNQHALDGRLEGGLLPAPSVGGPWDTSHVWGRYTERVLANDMLLREIYVYPGGRTSVHRHETQHELNFVAGGVVRISLGDDPENLEDYWVEPGDHFHVPPRVFHAVGFERAETDTGCARFYEIVYEYCSPLDIVRARPAIEGAPTRWFTGNR